MATGFVEWWDTYVSIGGGFSVGAILAAAIFVLSVLVVLACRRWTSLRVSESRRGDAESLTESLMYM
jgi:hypothetical protein